MGSLNVQSLVNPVSSEEQFTPVSQMGFRLDSIPVLLGGRRRREKGWKRREENSGRERGEKRSNYNC